MAMEFLLATFQFLPFIHSMRWYSSSIQRRANNPENAPDAIWFRVPRNHRNPTENLGGKGKRLCMRRYDTRSRYHPIKMAWIHLAPEIFDMQNSLDYIQKGDGLLAPPSFPLPVLGTGTGPCVATIGSKNKRLWLAILKEKTRDETRAFSLDPIVKIPKEKEKRTVVFVVYIFV